MIFGDHVRVPASTDAAERVVAACRGAWWTVGWFVPEGHEGCVRVAPPAPDVDDWWDAYRSLFATIAAEGAVHTATPERVWFAVWEGHGWQNAATTVAWPHGAGPGAQERRAAQAAARADDARRNAAIRAGLAGVPTFELPHRRYLLLEGPVAAAAEVREPGSPDRWQPPDLFWPDDRRWHVATDVDFWSLYVAGPDAFLSRLEAVLPTAVERVALDDPLAAED